MAAEVVEALNQFEVPPVEAPTMVQVRVRDPYWYAEAKCSKDVAAVMTPEKRSGSGAHTPNRDERDAIASFCGNCTVREDCLADALLTEDKTGIRAGLLPAQRTKLRGAMKKGRGYIEESVWQEALDSADHVHEIRRPRQLSAPIAFVVTQDKIKSFISGLPDGTYAATEGKSIFESLAEETSLTFLQVRRAVGVLATKKVLQKERASKGKSISSLRLVVEQPEE